MNTIFSMFNSTFIRAKKSRLYMFQLFGLIILLISILNPFSINRITLSIASLSLYHCNIFCQFFIPPSFINNCRIFLMNDFRIWDIIISVLRNLLLASMTILICSLHLFRVYFNSFGIISVAMENAKLKLALGITARTPIIVAKEAIETLPPVADKTIKTLSK